MDQEGLSLSTPVISFCNSGMLGNLLNGPSFTVAGQLFPYDNRTQQCLTGDIDTMLTFCHMILLFNTLAMLSSQHAAQYDLASGMWRISL